MKTLRILLSVLVLCALCLSCEKPYQEDEDTPVSGITGDGKPSGDNESTGGDEGTGGGDTGGYDIGDIVTVEEFLNNDINVQVFVDGYIVGDCTKSISNAEFDPPFTYPQALLIADRADESSIDMVMTVSLKSGSKWRAALNLVDHPENYRRRVRVFGFQERYLGVLGIKTIDAFNFI